MGPSFTFTVRSEPSGEYHSKPGGDLAPLPRTPAKPSCHDDLVAASPR
jgi:hypothetical protein